MSLLEKGNHVAYDPIQDQDGASSDDASEQEDLIYHGALATSRKARLQRFFTRSKPFLTQVLGLAFYSALLVAATSFWWKKEMLHGPGVVHCELDNSFQSAVVYNSFILTFHSFSAVETICPVGSKEVP